MTGVTLWFIEKTEEERPHGNGILVRAGDLTGPSGNEHCHHGSRITCDRRPSGFPAIAIYNARCTR
ncbi:hypothetical protein OA90_23480 [Labrenzia sp. OB1]|nr:hypothetical protein OA90_23480 [Labrenzia sp. OB1]